MLFYSQLNAQEAKDNDVDKNQNQEESTSEEPQKAVTESGENVILSPDGTWEYALDESKDEVQRTVNSTKFVTPALSKDSVKGRVVNYEINYDKEKWQILAKNINETAEYSLLHKDNNAYAIVIPENATIPLEALRNIVIKNARSVSGKVKILKEEERNVNGSKVIMLNMKAKVQGMDFIYLYYIYSGEKATIQVIGFTTEELFSEYQNDLENLLNGLVVKKGENPVKP
jgi:VCBS repeat-containing protein